MSSNSAHDSGEDPQINKVDPSSKEMKVSSIDGSLWNLDDDESVDSLLVNIRGSVGEGMPAAKLARVPRVIAGSGAGNRLQSDPEPVDQEELPQHDVSDVKLNIHQRKDVKWSGTRVPEIAESSRELDDLETWIDDGGKATGKELEDAVELAKPDIQPEMSSLEEAPVEAPEEAVAPAPVESGVSNSPRQAVAPSVERRLSDYSMLEKFGMTALVIALLAVLTGVFIYSSTRLPVESLSSRKLKFPISGKHVTILAAKTYWRHVVQSGPEADVVRRGTRMLPILELSCTGGPGVLRVLFRDENGDSVGDTITRQVSVEGKITMASTAGFDDVGMHAAYRTGESKPWKIEVYEGGAANVPGDGFIKLFEMDISTERR